MPPRMYPARTTTRRPRRDGEGVPPLEARIMALGGQAALEAIAKRTTDFPVRVTPPEVNRAIGFPLPGYIADGLRDLGYIRIHGGKFEGCIKHASYTLTRAGWDRVGGAPIWLVEDAA